MRGFVPGTFSTRAQVGRGYLVRGWLAVILWLVLVFCGPAFSAHEPSTELQVEVLEVTSARAVHLRLTATPLVEAPSLEVSCEVPWTLSVISDHTLSFAETTGSKRVQLWKGALKKDQAKAVEFWIQAPDLGVHEAVLTAVVTFPDSDWRLANAVAVSIKGQKITVNPLLFSERPHTGEALGVKGKVFWVSEKNLGSEPIREVKVEAK